MSYLHGTDINKQIVTVSRIFFTEKGRGGGGVEDFHRNVFPMTDRMRLFLKINEINILNVGICRTHWNSLLIKLGRMSGNDLWLTQHDLILNVLHS